MESKEPIPDILPGEIILTIRCSIDNDNITDINNGLMCIYSFLQYNNENIRLNILQHVYNEYALIPPLITPQTNFMPLVGEENNKDVELCESNIILAFINMNTIDRIEYILEHYGDIQSIVDNSLNILNLFASLSLNAAQLIFNNKHLFKMIIDNYINVKLANGGKTKVQSVIQINAIKLLIILVQSSKEIAIELDKQGIFNILKRFLLLHEDLVYNSELISKDESNLSSIQISILYLWRLCLNYNIDISQFIPICSEYNNTLLGLNSNGKLTKELFYLLETLCKNDLEDINSSVLYTLCHEIPSSHMILYNININEILIQTGYMHYLSSFYDLIKSQNNNNKETENIKNNLITIIKTFKIHDIWNKLEDVLKNNLKCDDNENYEYNCNFFDWIYGYIRVIYIYMKYHKYFIIYYLNRNEIQDLECDNLIIKLANDLKRIK